MLELWNDLQSALAGQYRLEREIGRGGMAVVYLARDTKHDRPVALKVIRPDLAASLGSDRFRREISLAARLQHPHILSVHDSGETPSGRLWFTMPYVEGESLRDRLRRDGQLPIDDAVRIACEVASALEYANRRGVVHRDVKPENILLTTDHQALVADFGIARALTGTGDTGRTLTEPGAAVGTPAYMSPEQAAGERNVDARSDVYSAGVVLYEMLAGEPPYTGPTAQAIVAKMMAGDVPSLRRVRPLVGPAIDAAIRRALAVVPADRYQSAADFGAALRAAERDAVAAAPGARHTTGSGPRRAPARRLPTSAALLGLGFLVGVGALFAWRARATGGSVAHEGPLRVAVLPFDNLGDSSDAYFADGLTDAVRDKLAGVPGLQVIASTSSAQYRRTSKSPQQIGQELGVRYLLVGKVRWAKAPGGESRVEVRPELIETANAADKWGAPFDAALTDVFKIQADIAGKVAKELQVALTPSAEQSLATRPTDNLRAYEEYLKGEATRAITLEDVSALLQAVGFYQQAVARDSNFATAWAQLSRAEAGLYYNGSTTGGTAEGARQAMIKARALAPDAVETALAVGGYEAEVLNDNASALNAYATGLARAPRNAELLAAAALAERGLGRWTDAIAHFQEAITLDPRALNPLRRLAGIYLWLRRYPETAATTDRLLALDPGNLDAIEYKAMIGLAHGDLAGARDALRSPSVDQGRLEAFVSTYFDLYWALDDAQQRHLLSLSKEPFGGDPETRAVVFAQLLGLRGDTVRSRAYADTARATVGSALQAAPDNGQYIEQLGIALAYLGRTTDAVRVGERLATKPVRTDAWGGAYARHQLARIYLLTGHRDQAIDIIAGLLREPYYLTPAWLRIDPAFDRLRGDPRFARLLGEALPDQRPAR